MKQKISSRLFIIAFIAMLSTAVGVIYACYNSFENQVKNDLRIYAQVIEDTDVLHSYYENDTYEDIPNLFENIREDNLRITWIDQDGTVLYDNDVDVNNLQNHLNRPEIQSAIETGQGECVRKSDSLQMNTYYYAILMDDGTILRVSIMAKTITSIFLSLVPYILLILLLILFVCFFLSHYLTKQLLEPINHMAENLDNPIEEPAYKELVPFANKIRSQHENILLAAKSRQDFTANVSHELKTPLTAISGYAELIENNMVPKDQEVYFAKQIRENANRLLALINDIINLSELDHTEKHSDFVSVHLLDVAKEVCQSVQINAQKKNIELTCTGSDEVILANTELLKEMITNLVQNAIQYNNEGGYVQVRIYNEDGVVLSVKDNGIGIPKDVQDRVFERFYRVDKSRSRQTGGTGLGLAIVKHVVEIHDAHIELISDVGKGCQIIIRF
ncbi:MAG: ATP-binding protein [Erysipelotrichaceae bacterium]|uniref:sensor histidine kinase n=1 Tax=Floccifex sp. TaxID=2815810 RepID=UPI002A75BE7B|nr:ATP-binding protein [Floccifex sp.]MDD7280491.1 ATP-binding protein [Erysipelotrichaceae bacterium]MDY2958555.1 ATP-binding protein [Floccifex sp.]